jgi:DNA-directed RNA polymerase specialized sigma subunit
MQCARVLTSLEAGFCADPCQRSIDEQVHLGRMARTVQDAVATLPRERADLVRLNFCEDLTLTEIGKRQGRSKSRMCQLLARVLVDLRIEVTPGHQELKSNAGRESAY